MELNKMSDLPDKGTAEESLSLDEGITDIVDLFDAPEDEEPINEVQEESYEDEDESGEVLDEDEIDEDSDPEETAEDDEDEVDQEDVKGGRFAPDNAKIRLANGQVTTIAALKTHVDERVRDFQRDYTEKSTKLAEERKGFEATQAKVNEFATALQTQRDFLLKNVQENLLPQAPDPALMQEDPIGYMQQKESYDRTMGLLNQSWQQQQQVAQELEQRTAHERAKIEQQRQQDILRHHTDLQDPAKAQEFDAQFANEFLPHYGFTMDEAKQMMDHRVLSVVRDALRYRKIKGSKKTVKTALEGKPKMIKAGKRGNPQQQTLRGKKARANRLQQTGSMTDAVAALMDFDDL